MAHRIGRQFGPEPARAVDEVGLTGDERLEHAVELGGDVLPVGVDRRDEPRPAGAGEQVAKPEHDSLTDVRAHVADQRAGFGRLLGGRVLGAVHHHDRFGPEAGQLGRNLSKHARDGRLFVVGGNYDRDRRTCAGRMGREELSGRGALWGPEAAQLSFERLVGKCVRVECHAAPTISARRQVPVTVHAQARASNAPTSARPNP